ncbi:hypothetical protein BCR39DRAFT_182347 [Naematelia encephala]|uniref:Uncharacterized protein n=1 Tax=Naematelia encephala TaxID=71784 RepID=A0A1Y2B2L6_9TREE|nr:hypothetical protein BCR39DRAFT_182347 [Naematelia encephala]
MSVLPNRYYYTMLVMDAALPAMISVGAFTAPGQVFGDVLPVGYDTATDAILGKESPRVALVYTLVGACKHYSFLLSNEICRASLLAAYLVVGITWASLSALLLPLAKNGMNDRPDIAEKIVRAHSLACIIADPIHLAVLLFNTPRALLFHPSKWHSGLIGGFIWLGAAVSIKYAYIAGYGRKTAKEMTEKRA